MIMATDTFDDDPAVLRDTLRPLLDEIENIIAAGGTYVDAYYRLCDKLGRDWPKKRFYAEAADPDSDLGHTIAKGRARFNGDYVDKLWKQADNDVATAPRLLAEYRSQQDINAALKRFFPDL